MKRRRCPRAVPHWAAMRRPAILLCLGLLLACGSEEAAEPDAAPAVAGVDDARLRAAPDDGDEWVAHGRTWSEQRYSPLRTLDAANVAGLQRRWSFDTA